MTYIPEYQEDASGQQQFTGDGQLYAGRYGGVIEEQAYYQDELTGEMHSLIDEDDFQLDEDYEADVNDTYVDTIHDVYPQLSDALQWASVALDPETIAGFNEAVDSGDESLYMPMIEDLLNDYFDAGGLTEDEDSDAYEPEDDEEIEVTDEDYNNVVEDLQAAEPQGQEAAMPFLEAAVSSQGTNPLYSDWMAATARFHAGEIDWNDALDEMTAKYSLSDLAKMYDYLNND